MPMYSDRRVTQQWAKRGPPLRGCPEQSCGSVTTLARAPSPRCAPFLATEPLRAITALLSNVIVLWICRPGLYGW
jgi:hypothetical protein